MSCHVVTFATIVFSKCQCHVVTFASDVGTYDIDICDKSRNICAQAKGEGMWNDDASTAGKMALPRHLDRGGLGHRGVLGMRVRWGNLFTFYPRERASKRVKLMASARGAVDRLQDVCAALEKLEDTSNP